LNRIKNNILQIKEKFSTNNFEIHSSINLHIRTGIEANISKTLRYFLFKLKKNKKLTLLSMLNAWPIYKGGMTPYKIN
jgi:hypothetical protein